MTTLIFDCEATGAQLTQEYLKNILDYNPDTGIFIWKVSGRKGHVGKEAGNKRSDGYISIRINLKLYLAHRLAWLYMTGSWPNEQIDHINRTKNDNRFINLRDVSNYENNQNVDWDARVLPCRKGKNNTNYKHGRYCKSPL